MKRVLLTESIHDNGISYLQRQFEVEVAPDPLEDTLVSHIVDKDALVVRSSIITKKVIESGKNLKVIGRHGAGLDNIDISAASDAGVLVVNTPEANCISVAEHTVAVILSLFKKLVEADRAFRQGRFCERGSLPGIVSKLGFNSLELENKTLGVVGMGRIGRMVAQKCIQAFGMQALGFDKYTSDDEFHSYGVRRCELLNQIFQDSDVVSIHVPLSIETKDMIGSEQLSLMKSNAYLVNTSRGGVVNESALFTALKNKRIAGAAVDVFAEEPPRQDHMFFTLDNILLTPHMAAISDGSLIRMSEDVAKGVSDVLLGKKPRHLVNPEIWQSS